MYSNALRLAAVRATARAVPTRAVLARPPAATAQMTPVAVAVARTFTTTPRRLAAENDKEEFVANLALKLQNSPEFVQAVREFQEALAAKGVGAEELTKPSVKLMQVLMDKDVRAKTEKLAEALKAAGVTDEEIRTAAQSFAGTGLLGSLFGGGKR
ncbi:hypothetical protein H9P43_004097 [Blastocladiella emersonii ATCC 22665]|nr:hypothetical protein H9P43_004097 [Blastocladiella emersonii ATCC 22665]